MRVMVLVKATADSENAVPPTADAWAAMDRFNDDLAAAGVLVTAAGLKPSAAGRRVAFAGAARVVTSGPFRPTSELVAGFWIWEVADMDEAESWARRCPNPMPGPSVLELRPFHDTDDLEALVAAGAVAVADGADLLTR